MLLGGVSAIAVGIKRRAFCVVDGHWQHPNWWRITAFRSDFGQVRGPPKMPRTGPTSQTRIVHPESKLIIVRTSASGDSNCSKIDINALKPCRCSPVGLIALPVCDTVVWTSFYIFLILDQKCPQVLHKQQQATDRDLVGFHDRRWLSWRFKDKNDDEVIDQHVHLGFLRLESLLFHFFRYEVCSSLRESDFLAGCSRRISCFEHHITIFVICQR